MQGIKYLAGTFFSAALLFSQHAEALSVDQFYKMSNNDRADYLTLLYNGAMNELKSEGKQDEVKKLTTLFDRTDPKSAPPAFNQFTQNLAILQKVNANNAKDPSKPQLNAEVAFGYTLQQNGILIPLKTLELASQNFKPSSPPSTPPTNSVAAQKTNHVAPPTPPATHP